VEGNRKLTFTTFAGGRPSGRPLAASWLRSVWVIFNSNRAQAGKESATLPRSHNLTRATALSVELPRKDRAKVPDQWGSDGTRTRDLR